MEQVVISAIMRYGLLEGVTSLCAAVSGGADSMALLHVLRHLQTKFGFTLSAAHLHHMIRGEEADRDETFVKEICAAWSIPLYCEKQDVPVYAKTHKLSMELAAREVRYQFFNSLPCDAVATAHTASDHLETVLLNLTRGTALKGLCGIPPKRGRFIRPMISCTRQQVEIYCREHEIPYVTDSTNQSAEYTRNRIRHSVIPVLKEINPAVELATMRMSADLTEDEQVLSAAVDEVLGRQVKDGALELAGLQTLSNSVLKRTVKRFFEQSISGIVLDHRHVEEVVELVFRSGRVSLPKNAFAVSAGGRLYAENKHDGIAYSVNIELVVHDLFTNDKNVHNLFLKNSLDCDKIVGQLVVRTRLPGDAIQLIGRNGTKTLKKLFNEEHIPVSMREKLPVIADEKGVVWIHGIGAAARCAVTKKTKQAFIIKVSCAENNNQGCSS